MCLTKPIKRITPRMNLNVSYGLWVIMMYQYRLISCYKCPPWWVETVDNGEGYVCMGIGGTWKNSLLFPQIFCENKTALKICQ